MPAGRIVAGNQKEEKMPSYKAKVRGVDKPLFVKAKTAAQARAGLVQLETMSGDDVVEAYEAGNQFEDFTKTEVKE